MINFLSHSIILPLSARMKTIVRFSLLLFVDKCVKTLDSFP